MSQPCTTPKCERTARAACDCCEQNLCLQHLQEHNTLLVTQLNPLTDEINVLGERLKTLNLHEKARDCRQKLERWRRDCHEKIDRFFEQKYQELDHRVMIKIDNQREKILHIQSTAAKLIREQEATRRDIDALTSAIEHLKNDINEIDGVCFQISTSPLLINDNMVQIEETRIQAFDSSMLSSVYKSITYSTGSSLSLASSDRFLLIHEEPNLCLIDATSVKIKQVVWPYGSIYDMCWSTVLDRFFIINKDAIFSVDEKTMSVDTLQTVEKGNWLSCTCFDEYLFLSTNTWGTTIIQLRLSSPVVIVKEWKSPNTCTADEFIADIVCKNRTLALMIEDKAKKASRMELRSCETLDPFWSLPLDVQHNEVGMFRCCSLDCNEWLVVGTDIDRLLHITADGKLKQTITYNARPYRINLFASKILAVSTKTCISLHKID